MKISFTQNLRIRSKDKLSVILLLVFAGILYGMPYYDHVLKFPDDDSFLPDTSKTITVQTVDSVYRAIVANAQNLYLSKKYEQALTEFQKAHKAVLEWNDTTGSMAPMSALVGVESFILPFS